MILTVVYVFNFIDRNVVYSLVEPIKRDLDLTDTQIGWLVGPAFVFFYAFAGIPIARWADRGSRVTILTLGLALWSALTAACGLAQSYMQLMLARIGVGIGEASGVPTSQSILMDTFPPEQRYRTMSVFSIGPSIGITLGMIAGGWIAELYGWRWAFIAVGAPGLILALGVRAVLREPTRGRFDPPDVSSEAVSTAQTYAWLFGLRSYTWLLLGAPLAALAGYAYISWASPFFIRVHGMSVGAAGTWVGLASLIGGTSGVLLGGFLSDYLGQRDARWPAWIMMGVMIAEIPVGIVTSLSTSAAVALPAYIGFVLISSMITSPILGLVVSLAPPAMRATSSATYLFAANMLGLGVGPLLVGVLNDAFRPHYGDEGIRYTLLCVLAVSLLAAALLWRAATTLRTDLERTATWGRSLNATASQLGDSPG